LAVRLYQKHYAANFIAAGYDKAKQKAALAGCPAEWQGLVRDHIKIFREKGVKA
jgi:hypothetical protein